MRSTPHNAEADTPTEARKNKGPGPRTVMVFAVIAALLVLASVTVLVWYVLRGSGADDPSSEPTADAPAQRATEELALGEALETDSFTIWIVSAGPAILPLEMPQPEVGNMSVAVRATVLNRSDEPVAINGVPYALHQTALRIGEADYPGAFFSSAIVNAREGTVPPNTEITMPFVFEVPEGSREATFTWAPAEEDGDYPVIVVRIPDISSAAP